MAKFGHTIIPKSDQLNADDLVAGPITIKITEVGYAESAEQPCIIKYEGCGKRPYKPNKTMRKLIISQWGDEGDNWVGKFLRIYNDPSVKWAGKEVGGIVVIGMSDIAEDFTLGLNVTRGSKKAFSVKKLSGTQKKADAPPPPAHQDTAAATKEPDGQQGGTQGQAQTTGDFQILMATGDPLRFPNSEGLHKYMVDNLARFKNKAQLDAFIKRNEGNFDRYTQAENNPQGFMQQTWDMINKKKKEYDDAAEPNF